LQKPLEFRGFFFFERGLLTYFDDDGFCDGYIDRDYGTEKRIIGPQTRFYIRARGREADPSTL